MWKKLSSKIVHKNNWYQIREDDVIKPDGSNGSYFVINAHPAVYIIAQDTDKHIYLAKQYRYPIQKNSLELPAGSSDGEDILSAAKRELQEETGLIAKNWKQLSNFSPYTGISNEIAYLFLATELTMTDNNKRKQEDIYDLQKYSLEEIDKLIAQNVIFDIATIGSIAIYKAILNNLDN
jgi:ADP-ribose pyrophosphatase